MNGPRGGLSGDQTEDHDLPAAGLHHLPLLGIKRFDRVVAPLNVLIRLGQPQKPIRPFLRKNTDAVDTAQTGQDQGPVSFVVNWTSFTLELANTLIPVEPDEQGVPEIACTLKVLDMTHMEKIEATIGHDEVSIRLPEGLSPVAEVVQWHEFFFSLKHRIK